jgi:hypothetical protein
MRNALVGVQMLSFVGLAAVLAVEGLWKLAGAQALLGVVTVLVYT